MENKIIYQCNNCKNKYKSKGSLDKHEKKCHVKKPENNTDQPPNKENNYDVNMTLFFIFI